jgi:hypothetical protein
MCSSSERYRRRAIDAQYQASRAIDKKVKEAFEELAHNWLGLAEQAEWLAAHPCRPQPVQQDSAPS